MQPVNVFNAQKTLSEYKEKQPLFLGPRPGLFDTVNKHYPKIWSIYKECKSLDWDENEFDYSQCRLDFQNCPKSVYDMMIRTLAWQWEADSFASRSVLPLVAPFVSDTSLWAAWQRISDNESVHAATYSEIVRMSFDNPEDVLSSVLEVKESLARLDGIKNVFDDLYEVSHRYALGEVSEEKAYDTVFLLVCAMLILERIQFIGSFAITFTICSTNYFQPIGKAVQKIAQDELEVHVEFDKEILRTELATERGRASFERQKDKIHALIDEIVTAEFAWTDNLFSEGRSLVGTNAQIVKNFILFSAKDVYAFFGFKSDHKFPAKNPMPHVEDWINIGNTQAAPQEQDNNQYKVGTVIRDDSNVQFDSDF
jgi:ribonucleoside-diphosphate reductase beta chain